MLLQGWRIDRHRHGGRRRRARQRWWGDNSYSGAEGARLIRGRNRSYYRRPPCLGPRIR